MIGEKLEEARKSKGISIREAAEATKIRGEYLVSMEDNSFDINLPEIYIRGFLKNYAKFLQVDPTKILTDYDAQQLGKVIKNPSATDSGSSDNQPKSSFGRMDISDESGEEEEPSLFSPPKKQTPPPPTLENKSDSRSQENWADNKALYLKIGIVFAGVLILSTILIVLIKLIASQSDVQDVTPEIAQPIISTQPIESASTSNSATAINKSAAVSNSITLSASDTVTVIVEQTTDRKRLYSGTLNADESISLEKNGPVSIRFTNGSNLLVIKDGKEFRPSEPGVGRTVVE